MFCASCGLENQEAGTYCRRCGTMVPDPAEGSAGSLSMRRMSRVQKIKKMRRLGIASVLFSLASAVIIIITLFQWDVRYGGTLAVAAICSLLVAIYQALSFYLGRDVFQPPTPPSNTGTPSTPLPGQLYVTPPSALDPADTADLSIPTVTENTTRHLESVERKRSK